MKVMMLESGAVLDVSMMYGLHLIEQGKAVVAPKTAEPEAEPVQEKNPVRKKKATKEL